MIETLILIIIIVASAILLEILLLFVLRTKAAQDEKRKERMSNYIIKNLSPPLLKRNPQYLRKNIKLFMNCFLELSQTVTFDRKVLIAVKHFAVKHKLDRYYIRKLK